MMTPRDHTATVATATRTNAATAFAPHDLLAQRLLVDLGELGTDGSHDLAHILRVWRNAAAIEATETGCDSEILVAGVILHDCVAVEKNSPDRSRASRLAAARAREIVSQYEWPEARCAALVHAIEAHSFSAGIAPKSVEARILQDADRLDAIGAIGVARCFYVAGRMGSSLYDSLDPRARNRPLDDRRYALDHFGTKLLKLADGFQTAEGQRIARQRTADMERFLETFFMEMG